MSREELILWLVQRKEAREKLLAGYDFVIAVADKHIAEGRRGHLTALRKIRDETVRARRAITG